MFFTTIKLFFYITDIRASIDIIKNNTLYIINVSFWIDMILNLFTGNILLKILYVNLKLYILFYIKVKL